MWWESVSLSRKWDKNEIKINPTEEDDLIVYTTESEKQLENYKLMRETVLINWFFSYELAILMLYWNIKIVFI